MKTLLTAGAKPSRFRPPVGRGAHLWIVVVGLLGTGLLGTPHAAQALQVDLSLNLLYDVPTNPNSAGSWQLVAKSDGNGIQLLRVLLNSNALAPNFTVPFGTVNGGDGAGFETRVVFDRGPLYRELFTTQPATPDSPEAGVFYGYGTLQNGAPNFPGKPGGTNSIGPSLTSLSGVTNLPWGVGDVLGDAAWDTAAIVATGSFAAGALPDFFSSSSETHLASTYTSIGTVSTIGNVSMASVTTVTTIVRDNLMGLAGDYNLDGSVDAADYTQWRDTRTQMVPMGTGADGSGNGVIDQADYEIWKMNFGAPAPGGGAAFGAGGTPVGANPVPECASFSLLLGVLLPLASAGFAAKLRGAGAKLENPAKPLETA